MVGAIALESEKEKERGGESRWKSILVTELTYTHVIFVKNDELFVIERNFKMTSKI